MVWGCWTHSFCLHLGVACSFVYPERFSSCSQAAYRKFLEDYNPSCLLNKPRPEQVYGAPVCGNAFLEKGEECDCGTVEVFVCLSDLCIS